MTPDRWQRIEDVFHEAREHAGDERAAFLAAACADDPALRQEVESLLAQQDGTWLQHGVAGAAATVLHSAQGRWEGRSLGPYVLGPLLGVGGMGEVYRGRDTKLDRDVAVKILPDGLARHPDRLARFLREARVLASLNHANIAAIYGLEESDGVRALVLELVEGVTLADRLRSPGAAATALPVPDALAIARQIAEALEAAHERGIVHRDLKPANIAITPRGAVKVLDFGVAKISAAEPSGPAAVPVLATSEGALLGTVAYMSPEQARGLSVDQRADIWAFGCVLFEMITGRRPFPGDASADVIAGIMSADPDWTLLPPGTPGRARELLRRCLTKDPELRLRSIAEVRQELEKAIADPREADRIQPARATPGATRRLVPWVLGGLITAVVALVLWATLPAARQWRPVGAGVGRTASRPAARVSVELPQDLSLYAIGRGSSVAVSPDGWHVVYTAAVGSSTRLYRRSLDGLENVPIAGTDGGTNPFFSPDGRWIGFWTSGHLKKVPLRGGDVVTIVGGASFLGAAWVPDGTIVFAPVPSDGLMRVSANGGTPRRVTTRRPGEFTHSWPQWLPQANAVLYTIWNNSGFAGGRLAVQRLDGGDPTVLVEQASYGRVASTPDGRAYLVYARPDGLLAAPFDPVALRLTGPGVPVVKGVLTNLSGGAHYGFSSDGVLAYVPGGLDEANKTLLWVDRAGKETALPPIEGIGFQYRLSPDGRRLARPAAVGPSRDLWIDDLDARLASARLTVDAVVNTPVWTPDGQRVIYTSGAPIGNLFWRTADGIGQEERLTTSANIQIAASVTPDGKTLIYFERDPARGFDIWLLPLEGRREPRLFLGTPAHEGNAMISPDGRWVAFQSDVSGNVEIHLASFPDARHRVQVSKGGGFSPLWSRNGSELFYRTAPSEQGGGQMMAVSIDAGFDARVGEPRVLFPGPYQGHGDVAPDGRFLLVKQTTRESPARVIQLVLDWFDDLQAKVPRP